MSLEIALTARRTLREFHPGPDEANFLLLPGQVRIDYGTLIAVTYRGTEFEVAYHTPSGHWRALTGEHEGALFSDIAIKSC